MTEFRHISKQYQPREVESLADWRGFSDIYRDQIKLGLGLTPMPIKTDLNAQVFDLFEDPNLKGITVEKVCFEALPGFYCTGNLYRPKDRSVKRPGILNPHGHWPHGRLHDYDTHFSPFKAMTSVN